VEVDKELGMYAPGVDPTLGPKVLSQSEAARQRAAFRALSSQMSSRSTSTDSEVGNSIVPSRAPSPQPPRQPTPINSDNEDEDEMTEDQRSKLRGAKKRAKVAQPPRCPSARMRDDAGPSQQGPQPTAKQAAASQRTPGAKAPTPTKRQQVPKQPIEGSRAGGFRPGVGGSGQTDTTHR
jgi:hypothetical protein